MGDVTLIWPLSDLSDALEALARARRWETPPQKSFSPPEHVSHDTAATGTWLSAVAAEMGIRADPVDVHYGALDGLLASGGAGVALVPGRGFLVITGARRGRVTLLAASRARRHVAPAAIRHLVASDLESSALDDATRVVTAADVPPERKEPAVQAMLLERLGAQAVDGVWQMRPRATAGWRGLAEAIGLPRIALVIATRTVATVLLLLAWVLLGSAALSGRLSDAWVTGWTLLLATLTAVNAGAEWLEGNTPVDAGAWLKQRLLDGILRTDSDVIRRQGPSELLARVLEAEAVERLGLHAAVAATSTVVAWIIALPVLLAGSGGWLHLALLAVWTSVAAVAFRAYARRLSSWAAGRRRLAQLVVERMVGHRTRLVQEDPATWHEREDLALERHLEESRQLDGSEATIFAVIPRGWVLVALVGLFPAIAFAVTAPAAIALALAGILWVYRALDELVASAEAWVRAGVTFREIAPLYRAATEHEREGSPDYVVPASPTPLRRPVVLEAHDLVARHHGRGRPVLAGASLSVADGDRVLIEGASGSGKSTFAALLARLREPESGALSLDGLDPHVLGSVGWRARVAAAPQFHQNHLLTGTLAFNLLLGRWPARGADVDEAEALCRELGLGEVLDRMPSGIEQIVGETGWQLSHGERSRVFLARALLQRAEIVILDEAFAALDPETLRTAVACARRHARTLLVVAHP